MADDEALLGYASKSVSGRSRRCRSRRDIPRGRTIVPAQDSQTRSPCKSKDRRGWANLRTLRPGRCERFNPSPVIVKRKSRTL
jgi:hypothetical protein